MTAIYKKELKSYFHSVTGFIFISLMMAVMGILSSVINFNGGYPYFEYIFYTLNFVYLILVPVITMRAFSEERRQKTDQLLYSLPIDMSKVVLGKYFAAITVLAIPLVLSCVYPLVLSLYDPTGYISYFTTYGTILAFFLLGASLMAIGLFISSLTENQIISAVLSFGVLFVLYLMNSLISYVPTSINASFIGLIVLLLVAALIVFLLTKNGNLAWIFFVVLDIPLILIRFLKQDLLQGALTTVFSNLSPFDKLSSFIEGTFDISSVIYFISVAALFVFFTVQSMEKRRWS